MRKIFSLILCFCLCLPLVACSKNKENLFRRDEDGGEDADRCMRCDLLILDEAGSAWELDMVDKALLQKAVLERPAEQECVLTAHAAPQWMLDAADYATEMKCHRHPYQRGISARKGIEY